MMELVGNSDIMKQWIMNWWYQEKPMWESSRLLHDFRTYVIIELTFLLN